MTDWVLIILLTSRSTGTGMAVNSVRFRSEISCKAAANALVEQWNSKDMSWNRIIVTCTKDHP